MTLRIELDSVRKYRGAHQYRPIGRATCGDVSVQGDGANIQKLCAVLAENNPRSSPVEVYRAGTLCFAPATLGEWASGNIGKGEQPEHLKR